MDLMKKIHSAHDASCTLLDTEPDSSLYSHTGQFTFYHLNQFFLVSIPEELKADCERTLCCSGLRQSRKLTSGCRM